MTIINELPILILFTFCKYNFYFDVSLDSKEWHKKGGNNINSWIKTIPILGDIALHELAPQE